MRACGIRAMQSSPSSRLVEEVFLLVEMNACAATGRRQGLLKYSGFAGVRCAERGTLREAIYGKAQVWRQWHSHATIQQIVPRPRLRKKRVLLALGWNSTPLLSALDDRATAHSDPVIPARARARAG